MTPPQFSCREFKKERESKEKKRDEKWRNEMSKMSLAVSCTAQLPDYPETQTDGGLAAEEMLWLPATIIVSYCTLEVEAWRKRYAVEYDGESCHTLSQNDASARLIFVSPHFRKEGCVLVANWEVSMGCPQCIKAEKEKTLLTENTVIRRNGFRVRVG